mmetsp:Transcript_151667/g.282609  ORF Transcript_151667/g.282609 Transcript_151667/m.282609 type:complete len:238 (+) Transcript_151667:207-920(+)
MLSLRDTIRWKCHTRKQSPRCDNKFEISFRRLTNMLYTSRTFLCHSNCDTIPERRPSSLFSAIASRQRSQMTFCRNQACSMLWNFVVMRASERLFLRRCSRVPVHSRCLASVVVSRFWSSPIEDAKRPCKSPTVCSSCLLPTASLSSRRRCTSSKLIANCSCNSCSVASCLCCSSCSSIADRFCMSSKAVSCLCRRMLLLETVCCSLSSQRRLTAVSKARCRHRSSAICSRFHVNSC